MVDVADDMQSYCGRVQVYVTMSGLVAAAADGNVEFMNESFAQLFLGYKHKDLTGKVLKSVHCWNSLHYISI